MYGKQVIDMTLATDSDSFLTFFSIFIWASSKLLNALCFKYRTSSKNRSMRPLDAAIWEVAVSFIFVKKPLLMRSRAIGPKK